jgi:hypothetical protein
MYDIHSVPTHRYMSSRVLLNDSLTISVDTDENFVAQNVDEGLEITVAFSPEHGQYRGRRIANGCQVGEAFGSDIEHALYGMWNGQPVD